VLAVDTNVLVRLLRRDDAMQAAAAGAAIAKGAWVPQLVLHDADVLAPVLAHFRAKPALGFSDCLELEIARKAGHLPLANFDKALGKLPGTQRI
jgi:predicted nucleic acid-binding protein